MRRDAQRHRLLRPLAAVAALSLTVGVYAQVSAAQQTAARSACHVAGAPVGLALVPEASGVAVSRTVPGRLWTHNDSSQPVLFALDSRGAVTGRLVLQGAAAVDWEAVAAGPCPSGSCLYVGDIGDNGETRDHITVYRAPEPGAALPPSVTVEAFHARYPDGAHDAETLLVAPDGGVYIVTKGSTGPVSIYRFPRALRAGVPLQLERVGEPRAGDRVRNNERITDGALSSDGDRAVLRTHDALLVYRAADLLSGRWHLAQTIDLRQVGEAQGEGVALGPNGTFYLVSEGGGGRRSGTFATLVCSR